MADPTDSVDANAEAPNGEDGAQQRIKIYENYCPKQEVADAVDAFLPVLHLRLSNLKWMSAVSGAVFVVISTFLIEYNNRGAASVELVSGLLTSAVIFMVSAIVFGVSYVRVTAVKMDLHNYKFKILISPFFSQPRYQAEQSISSHLDTANKMDGFVAFGLWLFGGGLILSLFMLFLFVLA